MSQPTATSFQDSSLDVILSTAHSEFGLGEDTVRHCERVRKLAYTFSVWLGNTEEDAVMFGRVCGLHDIGKVYIPDSLLNAPRSLTAFEYTFVQTHTTLGAGALSASNTLTQPLKARAVCVAQHHHEQFDGKGYPTQCAGDSIPLEARMCSLIDAFDVMLSGRPYQRRMTAEDACAEISAHCGTQFDPHLGKQFLAFIASDAFAAISNAYVDQTSTEEVAR